MKPAAPRSIFAPLRALTWADAGILATVLIWGLNMVVVKATLSQFRPLVFASLRFAGAATLETIILLAMGQDLRMPWRDLWRTIVLVLFGGVAYQVLFIFGINRTTAGHSSLLLAAVPIFVALYTGLFQKQRLGRLVWLGAALTFAGILLLTLGGGASLAAGQSTLQGDALVLLAAIGWAAYTIGSQSLMKTYSPLKLTTFSMLITAPALLGLALPDMLRTPWAGIPLIGWAGVAFSAIFGIAVAFLLWNISVKRLGSARTTIYSNLTPIIALVAGGLLLGEQLHLLQLGGALMVLMGIGIARLGPPPAARPAPEEPTA